MSIIPSVTAVKAGDPLRVDTYNMELKGSYDFLLRPPRAYVYATAGTTFTSDVWRSVTFSTALYDSDMCFSTASPTYLTCRTSGLYEVLGQINYGNIGTVNQRAVQIIKNGQRLAYHSMPAMPSGHNGCLQVSAVVPLTEGESIQLQFYQANTGSPITSLTGVGNSFLAWRWVDVL